jgi:hypothetical protein
MLIVLTVVFPHVLEKYSNDRRMNNCNGVCFTKNRHGNIKQSPVLNLINHPKQEHFRIIYTKTVLSKEYILLKNTWFPN